MRESIRAAGSSVTAGNFPQVGSVQVSAALASLLGAHPNLFSRWPKRISSSVERGAAVAVSASGHQRVTGPVLRRVKVQMA